MASVSVPRRGQALVKLTHWRVSVLQRMAWLAIPGHPTRQGESCVWGDVTHLASMSCVSGMPPLLEPLSRARGVHRSYFCILTPAWVALPACLAREGVGDAPREHGHTYSGPVSQRGVQ